MVSTYLVSICVKKNTIDIYNILGKFIVYLKHCNKNISPNSLKNHIITVKNFFEYSDIDISPRKFKLKVKLPKIIRKNQEGLSKEDVVDILNACSDIRLKTYVMFLAAGGFRAVEALSVRIKDLELESKPATVFSKRRVYQNKADRIVFLTEELTEQLRSWLTYKYRKRRICRSMMDNKQNVDRRNTITEYRTPDKNENDLIFAVYQSKKMPYPDYIYDAYSKIIFQNIRQNGKRTKRRWKRKQKTDNIAFF